MGILRAAVCAAVLAAGCMTPEERLVLRETNAFRAEGPTCGFYDLGGRGRPETAYAPAPPLRWDRALAASARAHAAYMAETGDYRHQTIAAIRTAGGSAENIASVGCLDHVQAVHAMVNGFEPFSAFPGWRRSPGHCHAMALPGHARVGIGVAGPSPEGRYYGVQVFGR